nr:uncharacterized protein LOC110439819 [Danio rerio]|eukprot:XP_021332272.1 uncharacterized protein LOC110439819 [Danio rerio]
MPTYFMLSETTLVEFLAESGASRSCIRPCDLQCEIALKNKFHESLSASGHTVIERFTAPLTCETEGGKIFRHAFVCLPKCPIPILGRDILCKLNLILTADSSGVRVIEGEEFCCLQIESQEPKWAYEWLIEDNEWAHSICKLAKERVKPFDSDMMSPGELHCTSQVVIDRDDDFEKAWFEKDEQETLKLEKMYWNGSFCAVSVSLSEKQLSFYLLSAQAVPHISVCKGKQQSWADLGPFVKQCVEADDWESRERGMEFSKSAEAFRVDSETKTAVSKTVTSIDKMCVKNSCMVDYNATDIHPALAEIPSELWAKSKYDVGLIKGCEPVTITAKSDYRPCQQQYPLKREAIEGITPVFEALLEQGVIVPCNNSEVRTPIFPVKKIRDNGMPTEWRFVQDLQAVNAAVKQRAPLVPNPYTILSQFPEKSQFYSVVDLANAFFSVPVDKDSQFWFAFNFNGKGYTFIRLCQGFTASPTLYNEALLRSLEPLTLTAGTALLQYVDDLLICAEDEETCVKDTVTLLKHLAKEGHKVSLTKLQFVKQKVTFLGHVIAPHSKSLSEKRVSGIKNVPKPLTKKQMLSFLGMCSYCRTFIPNYAILEQPLRALTLGKGMKSTDKLEWTTEAEQAFVNMKLQMAEAPALGLPVPTKPFVQMVDERNGFMMSLLLQDHGGRLRPVAYFSSKLEPVAAGLPRCLRAVAAAEKAVMVSRDFVGYSDLILMVPHSLSMILQEQKTSHLSTARWLRYHTILLDMPNVTVKRYTGLNAATLLPTEEDGEGHHCCLTALEQVCTPRPDLSDKPLENCDNVLFVDGSAFKDPQTRQNKVGYAVTTEFDVMASGKLPGHYSAQAAELVALTEACNLMAEKEATIYTDSRYAFGVAHDFGALWKHRKFLKSDGRPIVNAPLVAALLDAILLPDKLAICKCVAHTNNKDSVSVGNSRADAAAKVTASRDEDNSECSLLSVDNDNDMCSSLQDMQTFATGLEKNK